MENSEIKDRILQILSNKNLTYSRFAAKLGVQPSSISHIIAGRNKPGLEFLQKILKNFTDINPLWLIVGKGEMFTEQIAVQNKINFNATEWNKNEVPTLLPDTTNSQAVKNEQKIKHNFEHEDKKIKKIIVFYTDNTFEEYGRNK